MEKVSESDVEDEYFREGDTYRKIKHEEEQLTKEYEEVNIERLKRAIKGL